MIFVVRATVGGTVGVNAIATREPVVVPFFVSVIKLVAVGIVVGVWVGAPADSSERSFTLGLGSVAVAVARVVGVTGSTSGMASSVGTAVGEIGVEGWIWDTVDCLIDWETAN